MRCIEGSSRKERKEPFGVLDCFAIKAKSSLKGEQVVDQDLGDHQRKASCLR